MFRYFKTLMHIVIWAHVILVPLLMPTSLVFIEKLEIVFASSLIAILLSIWLELTRRQNKLIILNVSAIIFLTIGYLTKSLIILSTPYLIDSLVEYDAMAIVNASTTALYFAAIYVFILLMIFTLLTAVSRRNVGIDNQTFSIHYFVAYAVLLTLLSLKAFVYFIAKLGLPGVVPVFNIPLVGGAMVFMVRLGILFVINYFLLAAVQQKNKRHIILIGLITLVNIAFDLSIGAKYSLVYQVYFYIVIWAVSVKKLNFKAWHYILGALFVGFLPLLYAHVNYYRFGLLRGFGVFESVAFAIEVTPTSTMFQSFFEIIERITGIENFLITILNQQAFPQIGAMSLLGGEISEIYTEIYTGVQGATTATGSTQLSVLYLISNGKLENFMLLSFVFVASMTIFFVACFGVPSRIDKYIINNPIHQAYVAIFFMYFSFGSGNAQFYIKESLMVSVTVTIAILLTSRRARRPQRPLVAIQL